MVHCATPNNRCSAQSFVAPDRRAHSSEIGCGSGGNFSMLAKHGRLDAAEYNSAVREAALARGVANRVSSCDLPQEFPFNNELFDLIAMFDVLEHIEDDVGAIEAVSRHLTPSGWVVITVPASQFLWSDHDERRHHFRRYTPARLNQIFAVAGLRPHYQGYFNFWLFPVAVVLRLIKGLLPSKQATAQSDIRIPSHLNKQDASVAVRNRTARHGSPSTADRLVVRHKRPAKIAPKNMKISDTKELIEIISCAECAARRRFMLTG